MISLTCLIQRTWATMAIKKLDHKALIDFANAEIVKFHNSRVARLEEVQLHDVLKKKNPYLFRAKDIVGAPGLVSSILDAFLSSSEEELFGTFLEELAIFGRPNAGAARNLLPKVLTWNLIRKMPATLLQSNLAQIGEIVLNGNGLKTTLSALWLYNARVIRVYRPRLCWVHVMAGSGFGIGAFTRS